MRPNSYSENASIADLVIEDYRISAIFRSLHIDFYCDNSQSLQEICELKSLNYSLLVSHIQEVLKLPLDVYLDYKSWDTSFLMEYIRKNHYKYIHKTLPEILEHTNKIAKLHGKNHSELLELAEIFQELQVEIINHITLEEDVLIPAISSALLSKDKSEFSKIKSLFKDFDTDHAFVAKSLYRINILTNSFTTPLDACRTYKTTFLLLEHFERHLQTHLHLENNILFPRILEFAKN